METITKKAAIDQIPEITGFIDRELEACGCPARQQMQIDVAIDELLSNIALYAYPAGAGEVTVGFGFEAGSRTAVLMFSDSGIPYNPLEKPDPDISLPAEKRQIGGLGIFIVRKTMDEMNYSREDGKNILFIKKKI